MSRLSASEKRRYDRDGFLIRKAVFGRREVALLQAAVERAAVEAANRSKSSSSYFLDGNRFVDAGHLTVQFEHEQGSKTIRVIEPVHELDNSLNTLVVQFGGRNSSLRACKIVF